MFDRLEDIVKHYEELMFELNNPSVAEDQKRFRKLMKEQSDLTPLVETYKEYKQAKQDVEDSLALLEEGERRGDAGDGQGRTFRREKKDRGAGAAA